MPKFLVEFSETQYYTAEIKADNAESAQSFVECESVDEKRFIRHGYTNVYHIEEI